MQERKSVQKYNKKLIYARALPDLQVKVGIKVKSHNQSPWLAASFSSYVSMARMKVLRE